jgi:hypothetical protein
MPDAYDAGIMLPFDASGAIVTEIDGVAINFLVNRTPLYSRLARTSRGSLSFKITSDNYRPIFAVLANGGTVASGATSFVVTDASSFMVGDVLESPAGEAILITADPNTSSNTLTVTKGYAGTTAASIADGLTLNLVGNTRTGGDVIQTGISRTPVLVEQYFQTFQFPYQVSGALESATDFALPPGMASYLGRDRAYAIQQCADSVETSSYYGFGVKNVATATRPMQIGLRSLITTNKTLSPVNAGAYMPSDLVRDAVQPIFAAGGRPDVMLVSTDWMNALVHWGFPLQRFTMPTNALGVAIDIFRAPFLNDIDIIPCPLMRAGNVFTFTSDELMMATKRPMFDKPRGSRGDAFEGDVIAEFAVELHNQQHHSYVSGVTGFAPQS